MGRVRCPGPCILREVREKGPKDFFIDRWTDTFVLGTHGYFLGVAAFLGRPDLFAFGLAAAAGSWTLFKWVRCGCRSATPEEYDDRDPREDQ